MGLRKPQLMSFLLYAAAVTAAERTDTNNMHTRNTVYGTEKRKRRGRVYIPSIKINILLFSIYQGKVQARDDIAHTTITL